MSWVHFSDTFPRARKQYRCEGCYEVIEIGEEHLARRGVSEDGGVHTWRWHPECEKYAFSDGDETYDLSPGAFSRQEAKEYVASLPGNETAAAPERGEM